jgi:hypothetical protein
LAWKLTSMGQYCSTTDTTAQGGQIRKPKRAVQQKYLS